MPALADEIIQRLNVLSPKDGDLIVISPASNVFFTADAQKDIEAWLKARGTPNVPIMDIGPDSNAAVWDEEDMNRHGWYRQPGCDTCEGHPAPTMKVRTEESGEIKTTYFCKDHS